MKRSSNSLIACGVLLALALAGLALQSKRHADAVAQATAAAAAHESEAQSYQGRIAELERNAAVQQAAMDKLLAYRDLRFALALAAFDEASDSADGEHDGFARAYEIWSNLAQAGDARASYHLGIMNMYGLGGAEFEQQIGISKVRTAAEAGYPIAQSLMGFLVERSDGTMVKTGDELALSWWQKAAQGNHCTAVRRMVQVYQNGELGVVADPAKAAEWSARTETCNKR